MSKKKACGCGKKGCTDIPELTEKDMAKAERKFKWPRRVVFEFDNGDDLHGFLAYMSDGGGEQQAQPVGDVVDTGNPKEPFKRVEPDYGLDFDYGWTGGPNSRPRVEDGQVLVKVTRFRLNE